MKNIYPTPSDSGDGRAFSQQNLDDWAAYASRNSQVAPHAQAQGMVRGTGAVKLHSTSAAPRHDAATDAAMVDGDGFMPHLRRINTGA